MHPQKRSFKFLVILLGRETILKRFKAAYNEDIEICDKETRNKGSKTGV